jgi:methionyl-tRNA synthetase
VWAEEYLEEGFHPDLLRFYLATNGGLQQDVDFSWAKFSERVNNELVGTLGNFLYRSTLFAGRNYGGTPDAEVSTEVEERIEEAIDEFGAAVNDYSIRGVGESAVRLARFGNEYIQREEPWNLVDEEPDRAERVIRDCVQLAKAVTVLFEPIAPGKAAELWAVFGGDERPVRDVPLDAAQEPPAPEFDEPTEPFEKVADERVAELNEKLAERVEAAGGGAEADVEGSESDEAEDGEPDDVTADLEPIADERISFDDFQDLDIRVGRIESAEPIEGADELVKLTVDIGVETRQIVAGIKRLHDVDALPGTKIVVVANLEKAELFGVESNGMLLAAGEQADLLTTLGDAEPGERVR